MQHIWPIALFTLVATLTPGGATTLATASGVQFGLRRSLPLLLGIATGLASMAAGAAFGLANILQVSLLLPMALKILGTGYLLWLAWKIARAPAPGTGAAAQRPTGYFAGFGMLCYNPKAWAMTGGAAAAYAPLAQDPLQLALLMGLCFGAAACLSLVLWCIAGRELARRVRTPARWRWVNAGLGLLLVVSIVPMWS